MQKFNLVMEVGEPVFLFFVEPVSNLSVSANLALHLLGELFSQLRDGLLALLLVLHTLATNIETVVVDLADEVRLSSEFLVITVGVD